MVDGMGASPTLRCVAIVTECESKISEEPEVGAFRMESSLNGRSSMAYCSRESELLDRKYKPGQRHTQTLNQQKLHEGCKFFLRWISPSRCFTYMSSCSSMLASVSCQTASSRGTVSTVAPSSSPTGCVMFRQYCKRRARRTVILRGLASALSAFVLELRIARWTGMNVPRVYVSWT